MYMRSEKALKEGMQAGKNALASVKETASNMAASAKSGMDKTKATLEEKVERMTAHHPVEKQLAEKKKQDKIRETEIAKREAREQNAAARHSGIPPHRPPDWDFQACSHCPQPLRWHR